MINCVCQLLQDVEFSQPLHAMENESEKNNNQMSYISQYILNFR
jgi:hypothetical protein